MRFIKIEDRHGRVYAVNADTVSHMHFEINSKVVWIYLTSRACIESQFTDINHAVDYIQRASTISLTQGV
jgi:hypothetical protein